MGWGFGTVLGAVGSAWGPVGTAAGGLIGGGIDKLTGGSDDGNDANTAGAFMPAEKQYGWGGEGREFYDNWQTEYGAKEDAFLTAGSGMLGREAPKLDWTQSDQARGVQMGAANSYQDVLTGKAPSLAQLQMKQGVQDANLQAMNNAASARGGGALLAQRAAAREGIMAGSRAAADGAMLRAKEQDAARAGLLGAGTQLRQGDQGQQSLMSQNELASRNVNNASAQAYWNQANQYLGAQQQAANADQQGRLAQAGHAQSAQEMAQGNKTKADIAAADREAKILGEGMKAGSGMAMAASGALAMPYDQFHGVRDDGAYMFGDSATGEVTPMPPTVDAELHRATITGEPDPRLASNDGGGGASNYADPSQQAPVQTASVSDVGSGGAPMMAPVAAPYGGGGGPQERAPENEGGVGAPSTYSPDVPPPRVAAPAAPAPAQAGGPPPGGILYNDPPAGAPGARKDIHGVAAQAYIDAAFAPAGGGQRVKGGKFQTGEVQQSGGYVPDAEAEGLIDQRQHTGFISLDRQQLEDNAESQRLQQKQALDYEHDRMRVERMKQAEAEVSELSRQAKVIASEDVGNVDPNRAWKERSTGQKAVAWVAAILGGVGAGMAGGENAALKEMAAQRDNDIKAQLEDIKNTKDRREKRLTSVQQMMVLAKEQGATDQEAINYARMTANEHLVAQIRSEALKTGSPIAIARADETIAKIREQDSQFLAENAKQRVGQVTRQYAVTQDRVVGGGGMTPQKRAELLEKAAKIHAEGGGGASDRPVFVMPDGRAVPAQHGVSKEIVDKGNDLIGKVMLLEDAAKKGKDVGYVFSEKEATIVADTMGNTQSQLTGGGVPAEETRKAWVKGLMSPIEKDAILAEANRTAKAANATVLRYTDPKAGQGGASPRSPLTVPGVGEVGGSGGGKGRHK